MSATTTEPVVYLNGALVPIGEAHVSVLDRGFIFGDGIYEVVPMYATSGGRRPFLLDQHLERLARSLAQVRIDNPFDAAGWRDLIARVVAANPDPVPAAPGHWLVYIQVTRGVAPRGHAFPTGLAPTVFMMTNPMTLPDAATLARGVSAVTAIDMRWLHCDIKSTSLLGNVLMAQHAVEHDAFETIQLRDGWLTEASAANVWIAKHGRLYQPPRSNLVLEGIRIGLIERLAAEEGIASETREVSEAELRDADEIILTSATKELLPVTTLDGRPVNNGKPGPLFATLYAAYQRAKAAELGGDTMNPVDESLFEFPCDFPIKVMGKSHPDFVQTILALVRQFDAKFDDERIELRPSSGGNYVGLTCMINAESRAQLDDIYRALTSHPMVSVVL